MCNDIHVQEQWQLLQNLRSTVEGLLIDGVSNVWNIYGGLNRLHNVMEQIFKHGCRIFNPNGEPDCWTFIQGLNWLQPSLAISPLIHENEDYFANLPDRITSQKDTLWLYKSLECHSLSQKLSWLLSDKEHLLSCLEPWAFLCQENLAVATLICLRAVERNEPMLLAEIDPSLFLPTWIFSKPSPKRHRRSSSYPINHTITSLSLARNKNTNVINSCKLNSLLLSPNVHPVVTVNVTPIAHCSNNNIVQHDVKQSDATPLKTWNSLPVLSKDRKKVESKLGAKEMRLSTMSEKLSHLELSEIINVNYSELKPAPSSTDKEGAKTRASTRKIRNKMRTARSSSTLNIHQKNSDVLNVEEKNIPIVKSCTQIDTVDKDQVHKQNINPPEIVIHQHPTRSTSFLPGSAPEFSGPWSTEVEGQKDIRTPKKSFMEDGGSSVQPMSTGYFPQPTEGQSLTSFLSSAQFSRANAELDRENAHFSISEAMIAAIEQLKCNKQWRLADETVEESDEEINNLKQRIRLRRKERQEERRRGGTWNRALLSDGKTDTTTTDQSVSPLSSSSDTPSDSISTDGVEDVEVDDLHLIPKTKYSGISLSMRSLYSDADVQLSVPKHRLESNFTESIMSAEGVALSLISKFNEKQLPRASELQWLVSEKDAPQRLLPLPKSWPVSPDEMEIENSQAIPLRGTVEWAPPRPQIIFTPHAPPVRRTLIAKQNYMCAGCGMKVAVKYASRFRYCEYLGRYFCTGCHTNQVALIPGRILSKWDFNRYPVSNFSYRLLDQMTSDPLFQLNDLNPLLYRRVKLLDKTRLLRTQLFFLKDFLLTCRFATSLQEVLQKESNYMIRDPHTYSLQDLMYVKCGILPMKLQELVEVCCAHVSGCELCQARGFICELCGSKDVIFPWDLLTVVRCATCGACFHLYCKTNVKSEVCRRCNRLRARQLSRVEEL